MPFRLAGFPRNPGPPLTTGEGQPGPSGGTLRGQGTRQGVARARSYGYRSSAQQVPGGDDPGANVKRGETLPLRGTQPDEISDARSVMIIDSDAFSPGRGFMGRTEDALNTGRPPNRIDRGTTARNFGRIGVGGFPAGVAGWPYDGSSQFIPHVMIPRRPITVSPFQRTIDTSVVVSAPPIGGPIE